MTEPASTGVERMWRRTPWLAPLLVVVLAVAGMGVGFAVANDDDDSATPGVMLTNMQEACRSWIESYDSEAPPEGWCAAMTAWMFEQGMEHGATGSMMAGDAERLRETCRQWAIADPADAGDAGDAAKWCSVMVDWMQQHMGDEWDDWMMRDPSTGE